MAKNRDPRKRDDGTVIDPVKDLEEYFQSFPATGTPDPPEPKPAPKAAAPPPAEPAKPEPPAPPPVVAPAPPQVDEVAAVRAERDRLAAELAQERQRQQINDAARQAVADAIPRPVPPPPPARATEDERWQQYEELQFTNPMEARKILREIQDEKLNEVREKTKREVRDELQAEQRQQWERDQNQRAGTARDSLFQHLREAGVPPEELMDLDRIGGLYQAVSRPPTPTMPNPWFHRGGPTSAEVLIEASKKYFSYPRNGDAPPPAAPAAPQPQYIPPAPPGSSRPAPAATTQTIRATPISANDRRDIVQTAEAMGLDPEKMIERRRKRLAAEQEKGR